MSEKNCADCLALGYELEQAQLEIRRLRRDIVEMRLTHG